jgi:hypothetical protein
MTNQAGNVLVLLVAGVVLMALELFRQASRRLDLWGSYIRQYTKCRVPGQTAFTEYKNPSHLIYSREISSGYQQTVPPFADCSSGYEHCP